MSRAELADTITPQGKELVLGETSLDACSQCFSLPREELLAQLGHCRVLAAIKAATTPQQFEATVATLSIGAEGPFSRADAIETVVEVTGTKPSNAQQLLGKAKGLLNDMFGEDTLTVEGSGPSKRTYSLDPANIGQACIGTEPITTKKWNKSGKSSNNSTMTSFEQIAKDPTVVARVSRAILDGTPGADTVEMETEALRAVLVRALETSKDQAVLRASVSAGQKDVLSDKNMSRYRTDQAAQHRFELLAQLVRQYL